MCKLYSQYWNVRDKAVDNGISILHGCSKASVFGIVTDVVDTTLLCGGGECFSYTFVLCVPYHDVAISSADGYVAMAVAMEAGRPCVFDGNVL